jgi:hypothetical protein
MVRDIADGYLLVTERTFRTLAPGDLEKLGFELDRHLRELRGDHSSSKDDVVGLQQRNRKIQRVNSAAAMLRAVRLRQRP